MINVGLINWLSKYSPTSWWKKTEPYLAKQDYVTVLAFLQAEWQESDYGIIIIHQSRKMV